MLRTLILLLLIPSVCFALELGKVGNTYPILERDFLTALEEKAKAVDWQAMFEAEKERLEREIGLVSLELGVTKTPNTRRIDLTTTLNHDIKYRDKDGRIKVLYPKGFRFNPFEHIESSDIFVILNGTRQVELDWYEKTYLNSEALRQNGKLNVYPLVSKGNVLEISQRYKHPFTKLNQEFIDRFSIKSTPTVFYKEGKFLRIDEIVVREEKANE
jgi:hypothetical protein